MRPIDTPKYLSIANELREQILDGSLAPGSRFPTLAELQAKYGVAEGTVLQATKVLVGEDLIDPKPGAQTRVRERPEVIRMLRSYYLEPPSGAPWHADVAAQGRVEAATSHSKKTKALPAVAERLGIAAGDEVMRTSYTYTAAGKPAFLATSWEPVGLTEGTASRLPEAGPLGGWGVIRRLREAGIIVTHAVEEILPRTLTASEAHELELRQGAPVVVILRIHYVKDRPVETSDMLITSRYRPRVEIPVSVEDDG